jgi:hypothetical protein
MADSLATPPLLELTPRPDLDVLLGRWHYQPAHPAELRPCYAQLAELALATGCRFWLQDLRRRASPDQDTKRWLLDEYYPGVARRFGRRLYVAYLFSPDMHRQIVEAPDYAPAEAYLDKTYLLDFFGNEGAAIAWLQAWQAREDDFLAH